MTCRNCCPRLSGPAPGFTSALYVVFSNALAESRFRRDAAACSVRNSRICCFGLGLYALARGFRRLRLLFRIVFPVSAAAVSLIAYGGGGGGNPSGLAEARPCVATHDRGCVTESAFEALVDEAAAKYEEQESFQNQWGLKAINADRAYAQLELQLGPDAKPGEGVVVGVLDTGIEAAHPSFQDTTVFEELTAGAIDEDGSECSHGTAVAGIIA